MEHYLEALDLFESFPSVSDVVQVLGQLGQLHEQLGQWGLALHYHQRTRQYGKVIGAIATED
jgi:hypothetical protein